jgi:hypothetical protein
VSARIIDIERHLGDMTADYLGMDRPDPIEAEPLFPERTRQAPYPVEVMPKTAAMATWATRRLAFVPDSLAAQSVLAAMSLAVQPHFDIRLPTGQIRPCSLFLVTVAESGDRKSTSDDRVMTAVRQHEANLELAYAAARVEASHRQSAWDEARKEATLRAKKHGREALEAAYRDLGPRPDGPPEPTIVVRQGTTQGLLKRFCSSQPSLGLMSDEGGSWLGGYGMTDDNRLQTIATLSDFWDAKTVQMMTSGEGFTALRGKRLTFHLMIQPVLADRLLGNAEAQGQGFLSRLLVSHPESLAGTRFVDPTKVVDVDDLRAMDAFNERLARIVEAPLPLKPDTVELDPRALRMTPEAEAAWWEFYNNVERRLGPDGDLQSVKGFVGKLPEMAARIATVLAGFEQGVRLEEITREDLHRGIVIAEFYLAEALRLFGAQAVPQIYVDAETISQWLAAKHGGQLVTVSIIANKGPNKLRRRSDYIRDILKLLERHRHVVGPLTDQVIAGKKVTDAYRVLVGGGHG